MRCLIGQKSFSKIRENCEAILKNWIYLLLVSFVLLFGCKLFKNAEKSYEEGMVFFEKKDYQSALPHFKTALEINPKEEKYLKVLYDVYNKMYFHDLGEEEVKYYIGVLTQLIEINPDKFEYRSKRGSMYCNYKIKDYEKGIEDFTFIISKRENYVLAIVNRSDCYIGLNKFEEALKDLNYNLKVSPENTDALRARANFYKRRNQFDNAIEDFQKLIDLEYSAYILNEIGKVYLLKKDYAKAEEYFQKYISDYEAGSEDYKSSFENYELSTCYVDLAKSVKEQEIPTDEYCSIYSKGKKFHETNLSDYSSELEDACKTYLESNP